jgi:hypothetical protein
VLAPLFVHSCGGGGGGGIDVPPTFLTFSSPGTTLGEGDGPTSIQVVLHTTAPLATEATIEVADAGTGSATAGTDYTAFSTQTLTFPAGSTEGTTLSVDIDPLDDDVVDHAGEAVELVLQNPTAIVAFGDTTHTITLIDADAGSVAFAISSSATLDESAGTQSVAIEMNLAPGLTLEGTIDVRVSDLRTGSAAPTSDYTFTAQTVTFPAGSSDGSVQTVDVVIVADTSGEGDETVELGLSQPSVTCTLGAIQTHILTITDDDPTPQALFLAGEGATGTENSLAYNEAVALGAQTVGAGPTTGTLVRVANGGGQSMSYGPPQLTGSHPNDFVVEVESSSLASPTDWDALAPSEAPAPLAASLEPGVVRIDAQALRASARQRTVTWRDVVLPSVGAVTLELARVRLPIAPDAVLVVDGQPVEGGLRTLVGDLQLWSGRVAGVEGSRVFVMISERDAQGFVEHPLAPGRLVHLQGDGAGRARWVVDAGPRALSNGELAFCAGERFAPGVSPLPTDPPATDGLTFTDCRVALETDFQFFQKFNSSTLLTDYVTGMLGAISDQYVTDAQCTLSIAYLGIHTTSNDGWTTQEQSGADAGDLLDEFQAAWSNNFPVAADLAHFLSGDGLGGGIAYVNVLCSQSFGFGVSANLTGTINWGTWTGQPASFAWDFIVVAHEIGHNFGSQHTHDYCPPLDRCFTNCTGNTVCSRGTIMSYCHVSCGGLSNIDLYFHPVTANIMRANALSSCLGDATLLPGDFVRYHVRFNPLTTTGARSATLELTHGAGNVPQPFRVQLSGTAN